MSRVYLSYHAFPNLSTGKYKLLIFCHYFHFWQYDHVQDKQKYSLHHHIHASLTGYLSWKISNPAYLYFTVKAPHTLCVPIPHTESKTTVLIVVSFFKGNSVTSLPLNGTGKLKTIFLIQQPSFRFSGNSSIRSINARMNSFRSTSEAAAWI